MPRFTVFATAAILGLALAVASFQPAAPSAEVAVLSPENWDRFAEDGKETDAIYGDFVLRNRHVAAVIAQPLATRHANLTVKDIAGALIDLSVRGRGNDQLASFYPGRKAPPLRFATLQGQAPDAIPPAGVQGDRVAVLLKSEPAPGRADAAVEYSLGRDDRFITVTTTWTNSTDAAVKVAVEDDFRIDGGKEDMKRSPNGAASEFLVHDRYWGQAYALKAEAGSIQLTTTGQTTTVRYGEVATPPAVELAPGASHRSVRRVFVGASLLDVRSAVAGLKGEASQFFTFEVRDALDRPLEQARVELQRGVELAGSVMTGMNGLATADVLPGTYRATIRYHGAVVASDLAVDVAAGRDKSVLKLPNFTPGNIYVEVVDGANQPLPAKLELRHQGDTPQPDFGPVTSEFALQDLVYAPTGSAKQKLAPGQYDVVVSHGPEYDRDVQSIVVKAGETTAIRAKLTRSVDTAGWMSSDFHSHSSPSGDNTSSQLGRVINLLCEHVEFAPCTEHNTVSTYRPHLERLGAVKKMATVSGIELTGSPLPLNHQNVFPMVHRPRTQNGGGPTTDVDVETQVERLALWDDRSEKLIQQNHPDLGWLVFDKNGDREPDNGHERIFGHIDVVEVHPVDAALDLGPWPARQKDNVIFPWLQMLNQGYRVYGVVNTDSHYNYHGSGWLRNWIQTSQDDPAKVDVVELRKAAEQGRMVMSNGPFLEVSASIPGSRESVVSGQDLAAPGKKVSLKIRVQCPNWLDVDVVRVLANGRVLPDHNYSREKHGELFGSGPVKFDRTVELEMPTDAHLIVVAGHGEKLLKRVYAGEGGNQRPAAVSNPIYVDVDGGGFKPNGDWLGMPKPVKLAN